MPTKCHLRGFCKAASDNVALISHFLVLFSLCPFVLETVEKDRDIRARSSQTPILKAGHFEVRFAARCSSRKETPHPYLFVHQELNPVSRFFLPAAPMFGLWFGKSLLDFQGRKNKLSLLEPNARFPKCTKRFLLSLFTGKNSLPTLSIILGKENLPSVFTVLV